MLYQLMIESAGLIQFTISCWSIGVHKI